MHQLCSWRKNSKFFRTNVLYTFYKFKTLCILIVIYVKIRKQQTTLTTTYQKIYKSYKQKRAYLFICSLKMSQRPKPLGYIGHTAGPPSQKVQAGYIMSQCKFFWIFFFICKEFYSIIFKLHILLAFCLYQIYMLLHYIIFKF